ncbi:hypothetical protein KK083_17010 [Fulvivirgaceae bacterium PWU4]|uniref:Type 1 periplasmic binding fold superfamily protein n=1 Tax=Chryseosolibacter histidini TaxID=2782349 RepID=A0AAP2DLM0_9BACT|nr:hypothetical protein [Chryseosolibacter histidini]MBT1698595.1 hypothetical protein [Chryseosolibacter histidini]
MKNQLKPSDSLRSFILFFSSTFLVATLLLVMACGDDPKPVNEEEVITTMTLTLTPVGGGNSVTLKFYDEDGDGSIQPVKTVSGPLAAYTTYEGLITLLNETATPAGDITAEVKNEASDHLFCFTTSNVNLTVNAKDKDSNNLPLGIETSWVTGAVSTGTVKVVLRHQPGEKTGNCPGGGDTDIEVDFNVTVQ